MPERGLPPPGPGHPSRSGSVVARGPSPQDCWYLALESLGERARLRYTEIDRDGAELSRHEFPQTEVDAIGGLLRALRARRYPALQVPKMSLSLMRRVLGPADLAQKLVALAAVPFRRPVEWLRFDRGWKPDSRGGAAENASGARLLSTEETAAVHTACESLGVHPTALLIDAATSVLLERAVHPNARTAVLWSVAVNLRGEVPAASDDADQSATIPLLLRPGEGVRAAARAMAWAEAQGFHWRAWKMHRLLCRLGPPVARIRARFELGRRRSPWLGSFTNLGAWSSSREEALGWHVYTSPLRSRPIAAACLVWNGRLSLTLAAHPALTRDPLEVKGWTEAWADRVLSLAGDVLSGASS